MSNLYEQIELDIAGKLAPLESARIKVEPLPEVQATMERPTANNGRITVAYAGSTFDPVNSTSYISHMDRVDAQVVIEAKRLRGQYGVYEIMRTVKALLTGFIPTDCYKMTLKDIKYLGYDKSMWMYALTYTMDTIHVEDYEEPDDLPLLKEVLIDIPTTSDINDLFFIQGTNLFIRYQIADNFEIDENGNLIVSGPNENSYSIEGDNLIRLN